MNKIIPILLIFTLTAVSCTTTQQASTTRVMDVYGPGVLQLPVVGELDVDIEKVSGTASDSSPNVNIDQLKKSAVNNAVKNAEADILIEPSFEINAEGNETTVVASGFPATYTNFRSIELDDVPLLEIGQLQKATVFESSEEIQQSNESSSTLLKVASFLGGVTLLAIIASQAAE